MFFWNFWIILTCTWKGIFFPSFVLTLQLYKWKCIRPVWMWVGITLMFGVWLVGAGMSLEMCDRTERCTQKITLNTMCERLPIKWCLDYYVNSTNLRFSYLILMKLSISVETGNLFWEKHMLLQLPQDNKSDVLMSGFSGMQLCTGNISLIENDWEKYFIILVARNEHM